MIGEINIYGVLFPPLLIWAFIALLLSMAVRRGLSALGVYRFIWHRPLFDLCLLIMLTGLISLAANRYF
ncbi:MAG: DUF1656 domain-containing protein [Rhodospirillales bacterium]|nr:DUF1656 domain-containing protein [Rhodospirillales bacterium]MDE1883666.1 DUF1656 domain-containing protein [Rhodospirillales bacterium]MDE2391285.1 DUF1656 domain-containing protein [Rhodospirillales bacterium]